MAEVEANPGQAKVPWGQQPYESKATKAKAAAGPEMLMTISAGTAFKWGFFAFWGFLVAGIVPWMILMGVLGIGALGALGHATPTIP